MEALEQSVTSVVWVRDSQIEYCFQPQLHQSLDSFVSFMIVSVVCIGLMGVYIGRMVSQVTRVLCQ